MLQPDLNASSVEMKVARSRFVLVSEFSTNSLTGNINLSVVFFSSLLRSSEFSEKGGVARTGDVNG
jgi:hypothetical protein